MSIDHGVMEKLDEVLVVPGSFGWSDLGSFESVWELADKDRQKDNRAPRRRRSWSTWSNSFVEAPAGKRVAMIGVEDLVVVDTGDALLIMPRGPGPGREEGRPSAGARRRRRAPVTAARWTRQCGVGRGRASKGVPPSSRLSRSSRVRPAMAIPNPHVFRAYDIRGVAERDLTDGVRGGPRTRPRDVLGSRRAAHAPWPSPATAG